MVEPYFEELEFAEGEIPYPFTCFLEKNHSKSRTVTPHWHYYIELLYFLSGHAKVILGGESYFVRTGDFVLMNSREVHSIYIDDEDTQYIVLKFDPEVLYTTSRTLFEAKFIFPFTMSNSSHQKIFKWNELKDTPIPSLIHEIYDESEKQDFGFELAIRTGIGRLFLWVLRTWKQKGVVLDPDSLPNEIDIQRLQSLFEYLDKNYQEDISTEDMAKMCGMSYSYFSRQFKKIMRKTFTEYLNYIRITEAEKLLLSTDLNITEIAFQTGFSNSSYFIKQFKYIKNVSPKQFKKKALEEKDTYLK